MVPCLEFFVTLHFYNISDLLVKMIPSPFVSSNMDSSSTILVNLQKFSIKVIMNQNTLFLKTILSLFERPI